MLFPIQAQKSSFRFAESYFGLAAEISPQNGSFLFEQNGILQKEKLPSNISPRLLIGGTHFWGFADFYLSIPLTEIHFKGSRNVKYSNNVLTGFRFFPLKLNERSFRLFVGLGFNNRSMKLPNGPIYSNWQCFLETGISFRNSKNRIFGLAAYYFPNSDFNTAINRSQIVQTSLFPSAFSLSFKQCIDFSKSYENAESKRFFKLLFEKLDNQKKLNTYSLAIGLSAFIPFEKTEHATRKTFFNDEIEGGTNLDFGLGYYFHKVKTAIRISYRSLNQEEEAFDYSYRLNKRSLALEAFKFLLNYRGFVPFIGASISTDFYFLKEKDKKKNITDFSISSLGYYLLLGWDIRFTETDFFILRTNLRYQPNMGLTKDNLIFTSGSLEFNFIQLVFYPEKYIVYKKLLKN